MVKKKLNKYKYGVAFMGAIFLSSCSTQLDEYKDSTPRFDIKSYFSGNVIAWGIVKGFNNKVERRFCVEINGQWQENTGVLAEKFYFDDGEVSYRNWQLTMQKDGSYQGTAEDVEGIATGKQQGFAFQFQYKLQLKLDEKTYVVNMDDWMYQLDEYRVMNTTTMSKLGVDVAKITLFFDKKNTSQRCR